MDLKDKNFLVLFQLLLVIQDVQKDPQRTPREPQKDPERTPKGPHSGAQGPARLGKVCTVRRVCSFAQSLRTRANFAQTLRVRAKFARFMGLALVAAWFLNCKCLVYWSFRCHSGSISGKRNNWFHWIFMDLCCIDCALVFNDIRMTLRWLSMMFIDFHWSVISITFVLVFNGFQWFSMIFNAFQCFSIAYNRLHSFSMVFNEFQWFSMAYNCFQSFSIVFNDLQWF